MISVTELPVSYINVICIALFFAALMQLFLCVHSLMSSRKAARCIANVVLFVCVLTALSVLRASYTEFGVRFSVGIPWILLLIIGAVVFAYAFLSLLRERRRAKTNLSRASIRESLDNLESGICFADNAGRVILINRTMNRLISSVSGSVPQTLSEVNSALERVKIKTSPGLCCFPDGSIRRISLDELTEPGLEGFTQVTAQDVTELYTVSENIRNDNEKLRKTNEELNELYVRLADRIREQETLNLKMRIHNDIGTSLISISKIIEEQSPDDANSQLESLRNAVSYFSNNNSRVDDTPEKIQAYADSMNIKLIFDGAIPENEAQRAVLFSAVRESVTNCVTHSKGNAVTVKMLENGFDITDNGEPPKSPVKEGGGLASLRKRAESAGAKMQIKHSPVFRLSIRFNGEENV